MMVLIKGIHQLKIIEALSTNIRQGEILRDKTTGNTCCASEQQISRPVIYSVRSQQERQVFNTVYLLARAQMTPRCLDILPR